MKRLILLAIAVGIAILLGLVYIFNAPFAGVSSLGGNNPFNRCATANKQINNLSTNGGFLQGRLLDAAYKDNRIFVLFESIDSVRYSFMIVPRDLGNSLARDFYKDGLYPLRLKYYYLSFCGEINMFSTEVVEGGIRVDNDYNNIKGLIDRYISDKSTVLVQIIPEMTSVFFDRTDVIYLPKLFFLTKP